VSELITQHEPAVRLGAFATLFALMGLWEWLAPRRPLKHGRGRRWGANFSLMILSTIAVRLLMPAAAVSMAFWAERNGTGLFNHFPAHPAVRAAASFLILDFVIYVQHYLFHKIPLLWRLHRVHHADLDFDVSTGIRFHPLEILISMGIKVGIVGLIGAPPAVVILFEIALNAGSLFNHGNVAFPPALDRWVRRVLVTPDMHRTHHSVIPAETDSCFSFNFSWWDRIFGTYRARPQAGHERMTIGIAQFREPWVALRLGSMLLIPFMKR
jgi:sterol desaturase/sphingolipid hydroxylase (fatty acid hydroxylase superfamily)